MTINEYFEEGQSWLVYCEDSEQLNDIKIALHDAGYKHLEYHSNMSGDRVDHGACMNTLTTQRPSPLAKGNPQHTNLIQIEKV